MRCWKTFIHVLGRNNYLGEITMLWNLQLNTAITLNINTQIGGAEQHVYCLIRGFGSADNTDFLCDLR